LAIPPILFSNLLCTAADYPAGRSAGNAKVVSLTFKMATGGLLPNVKA